MGREISQDSLFRNGTFVEELDYYEHGQNRWVKHSLGWSIVHETAHWDDKTVTKDMYHLVPVIGGKYWKTIARLNTKRPTASIVNEIK